jgi:hypothetical protein
MPFRHVENACVFSASWAKPMIFSNNQGKTAPQYILFSLEIILFKIEITCSKKLKQDVATSLYKLNSKCFELNIAVVSMALRLKI